MNANLYCLRDPVTGSLIKIENDHIINDDGGEYPIVRNIPRFVGLENYAGDFGAQWNKFPKTQLDSYTGIPITEQRLERCLRGDLINLKGKMVLEAGSGAGRFTEVLLKHGAIVHSFDYSNAVDANAINNGHNDNLTLVQADIRRIPFEKANYDYVLCLGVLQHTPNPEESIKCLWEMVKPGGKLVIDHYRWNLWLALPPPIGGAESFYRWLALKRKTDTRYRFVKQITDFWFPIHWKFKDSSFIQRILRRVSPVHFYYSDYKLHDKQMYYEWALLDTHDGMTDFYKHYRNVKQIHATLVEINAVDVQISEGGNGVEAYCRKPV